MLGEANADFNDPKRQSLIRLLLTCAARINALSSGGAMLGDYNEQNQLRAVIIARRLKGPPKDDCINCCLCCSGTLYCEVCCAVSCIKDSDGVQQRSTAVDKMMKKSHETHGKGEHLYVAVMAVSPEHQGHGSCSRLMRTVSRTADKHRLPCYLEANGSRNGKIYERWAPCL